MSAGDPICWQCGRPAIGEIYSRELRRWRYWCRRCLDERPHP